MNAKTLANEFGADEQRRSAIGTGLAGITSMVAVASLFSIMMVF